MSANEIIPQEVADFLLKTIASVAELEALLLMRREMGSWSAETLAQRLYVPPAEAELVLRALMNLGFVVQDEQNYQYQCETPELDRLVERTAEVYARQLIPVTRLIHDHGRRIRRFADAFRLRRDP
jgi:DNA-binding IclR family transcriptional regulator